MQKNKLLQILSSILKFLYKHSFLSKNQNYTELGDLVIQLKDKFGLELDQLTGNILTFFGDNSETGFFKKKVQNPIEFKEKIVFELSKIGHKSGLDIRVIKADISSINEEFILVIECSETKYKSLSNVSERLLNMPNILGFQNNQGIGALLVDKTGSAENISLVYTYISGLDNRDIWTKKIEEIKQYLNYNIILKFDDEKQLVEVKRVPKLRSAFEFMKDGIKWQDYMKQGEIFLGFNVEGPVYTPLKSMTHLFLTGEAGAGKSVDFQLIYKSLLFNINLFEKCYMIDLKRTEFVSFKDLQDDRIEVVLEHKKVLNIVLDVELEMDARMAYMEDNRLKSIHNFIFLAVDEYAELNNIASAKGVNKKQAQNVLITINRLAALGRAMGIRLYFQTQFGTAESIDTTLRGNLQSRVLMRTKSASQQGVVIPAEFREEYPNPAQFETGRKIFQDQGTGEIHLLQSIFTENEKGDSTNFMEAYEMGKNIPKVERLEEKLKSYKIKILQEHLKDEELDEKSLEFYKTRLAEFTQVEQAKIQEENPTSNIDKASKSEEDFNETLDSLL